MRLLDYKRYERRCTTTGSGSRRRCATSRPATGWSALYQRLVSPMPGLGEGDRRVWRFVFIYPNTAIDLYPDLVWTWKIDADDADRPRATPHCSTGTPTRRCARGSRSA